MARNSTTSLIETSNHENGEFDCLSAVKTFQNYYSAGMFEYVPDAEFLDKIQQLIGEASLADELSYWEKKEIDNFVGTWTSQRDVLDPWFQNRIRRARRIGGSEYRTAVYAACLQLYCDHIWEGKPFENYTYIIETNGFQFGTYIKSRADDMVKALKDCNVAVTLKDNSKWSNKVMQ